MPCALPQRDKHKKATIGESLHSAHKHPQFYKKQRLPSTIEDHVTDTGSFSLPPHAAQADDNDGLHIVKPLGD